MSTYQEAVEQAYKQRQVADMRRASKLGLNTAEYRARHKRAIDSWTEVIRELMTQNAAQWFCVRHNDWRTLRVSRQFRPRSYACDEIPMTVRGGGFPTSPLAFMPIGRMGPPLRSFAADEHDCIVVPVLGPTAYKVVARFNRARKRAPL